MPSPSVFFNPTRRPIAESADWVNFSTLPRKFQVDFGDGKIISIDQEAENFDENTARAAISDAVKELGRGFKIQPGVDLPGLPPVQASTARGAINFAAEMTPELLSLYPPLRAARGASLARQAVQAGTRGGATPLARKLIAEPIESMLNIEPEPFGPREALGLGLLSTAGELAPVGASALFRKGARGGSRFALAAEATRQESRAIDNLYATTSFMRPSLPVRLEAARAQGFLGFAEKSMFGAPWMKKVARKGEAELLSAQHALAPSVDIGEIGGSAIQAAERKIKAIGKQQDHLYSAYRAALPDDYGVKSSDLSGLKSAVEEIADIGALGRAAGGSRGQVIASRLERLLKPEKVKPQMQAGFATLPPVVQANVDEAIPWEDLEYLRDGLGKIIRYDKTGETKRLWKALHENMEDILLTDPDVSGDAVAKWQAARQYYRESMTEKKAFYDPIVDLATRPSRALKPLRSAIYEGDVETIKKWRLMATADEWNDIERQLISEAMLEKSGNTRGLQAFERTYGRWSPAVRDAMLTPEKRQVMDALESIARRESAFGHSRTVQRSPLHTMGEMRGLLAPVIGGTAGGAGAAAIGLPPWLGVMVGAGAYPMGVAGLTRLLTWQPFSDWLVAGAKLNMNGWAAHLGRLSALAAYEDDDVKGAVLEFLQNIGDQAELSEQEMPTPGMGLLAGR